MDEFSIEGLKTNIPLHQNLLSMPAFVANDVYTTFIADQTAELVKEGARPARFAVSKGTGATAAPSVQATGPDGTRPLNAHLQGRIVSIDVAEGDSVAPGQQIAVLESMKMEHIVSAETGGIVREMAAKPDDTVFEGAPLLFIEESDVGMSESASAAAVDLDYVRPDLEEVIERHAIGLDERRNEAFARRRGRNQRTARENIDDLCDPDSFIEYGALVLAAQRRRRSDRKSTRLNSSH